MLYDPPRCQLHSQLARTSWRQHWNRLVAALRNRLRLRTRWREWQNGKRPEPARLGKPSRFAEGSWVRVRDAGSIFATLSPAKTLRGLVWVWQQWPYCGTVHRVFRPVQRMMDDGWQIRPISGTVLLETVPCGGPTGHHGCGRECPMMFRDEWLEEVSPPLPEPDPPPVAPGRFATVRSAEEIRATLDGSNSRQGLMFMPEMYRHAGQRFPVRKQIKQVLDGGRYVDTALPVYILDGLHCGGEILGADGPCHRSCRLLWHEDWLVME